MRLRVIDWKVLVCVLAVGLGAYLGLAPPTSTAQDNPNGSPPERQFSHFPDVPELLDLFDSGALGGTRRPGGDELEELQIMVDDLNRSWHEARTEQHALIEIVAREKVRQGEVHPRTEAPSLGHLQLAQGAIGVHMLTQGGLTYLAQVFPGESPELDDASALIRDLKESGYAVIRSYFE